VPRVLASSYFQVPPTAVYPQPLQLWQSSLLRSVGWLLAGGLVLGLAVGLWRARPRLARGLFALLPLVLMADLWVVHGNYNPTVAAQDYYPPTAVTQFLQQQPGVFRSVGLDWTLMPNTSMFYGLDDLGGYDSLEPRLYHDLAAQLDPTRGTRINPDPFHRVQSPLLNLLNVRYVVAAPGTDPNYAVDVAPNMNADQVTHAIEGGTQVGQTFVPQQDNVTQITVQVITFGHQPAGRVRFHLKTAPTAATDLVTQTLETGGLADNSGWTIQFAPLAQTRGQALYFYFESVDVPPGHGVGLQYDTHEAYPQGTRMDGGRPAGGDLAFATTVLLDQTDPWFVRVLDGGATAASVFENRRVLPRAWLAHQVDELSTPKAVRLHLSDAGFDAAGTALVSSPLAAGDRLPAQAPPAGTDVVTITQYAPEAVTISTQSPAAGVLILSDEAFPGWQAQVDGAPVAILTVDYGLRGVYLPAGTHRVSFIYAPESFRLGAEITAAAILLVGMLVGAHWLFGRRQARRRRERSIP
jgi:Bacterial membrane protein YfhO